MSLPRTSQCWLKEQLQIIFLSQSSNRTVIKIVNSISECLRCSDLAAWICRSALKDWGDPCHFIYNYFKSLTHDSVCSTLVLCSFLQYSRARISLRNSAVRYASPSFSVCLHHRTLQLLISMVNLTTNFLTFSLFQSLHSFLPCCRGQTVICLDTS